MKRSYLVVLAAFLLAGCEQYAKLVDGSSNETPAPAPSLLGGWVGTVNYAGADENVFMSVSRPEGVLDGLFFINSSSFTARISGTVSGSTFILTLDEGTGCTNKWTFAGTYGVAELTGTFSGSGNPGLPGTTCYPDPITETIALSKNP